MTKYTIAIALVALLSPGIALADSVAGVCTTADHKTFRFSVLHDNGKYTVQMVNVQGAVMNVPADMGTNGYPKPIEYGTPGGNIEINWDDSGKMTVIMPPNAKGYVFKRC